MKSKQTEYKEGKPSNYKDLPSITTYELGRESLIGICHDWQMA